VEITMRKILLSATLLSSVAAAQSRLLTIDDILGDNGGRATQRTNQASPDGAFIAQSSEGQLLVKTRTGEQKVLDGEKALRTDLQWSSDSHHLAFIRDGQVWVTSTGGGGTKQLTHDAKGPGDPRGAVDAHIAWNPNGHWILFESGKKGFNELYVVNEDGGEPRLIAATEIYHGKDVIATNKSSDQGDAVSSDRFDPHPSWSPDGKHISYTERSREFFSGKLKVLDFDEESGSVGKPVNIYVAPNDPGGAWAVNTAVWSPHSTTLVVVLQETHWDKLWLIPIGGGKKREMTFGKGEDEDPIYSPDGKWIAFLSNRDLAEERHVWVVSSQGGEPHRISQLPGIDSSLQWSVDSKSVTFVNRSTLGTSGTYRASVEGKGEAQLQGEVRRSIYEGLGITPEVVHYKGKDGLPLAGILYKPVDYKVGNRYPLVVLAHGGPEGQVALTVAPWSAFLADQGYLVFEPNFRGSTGYGERFRNANVEDSGGGEIDDVVAGVQYLVHEGLADPVHVGISGGSHGGTVVANAITKYPEIFAVGIEKFGVVDRALFLQYTNRNSAIRWETKMGGPPEAKPSVYQKANILSDVLKIKTPVLVLHGEEDPQVPPQESQQFVAALRASGKTYDYKTYPHEGHGFQQLEHRKDADERELAYLNRYLKPELASSSTAKEGPNLSNQ
jgi:dipeptidyl aminopeptidase/acylaminoacyl peptidase